MIGVVSSISSGGNFIFAEFETPSMSILYKNARNVRFVLFRKNSNILAQNRMWSTLLVLSIVMISKIHSRHHIFVDKYWLTTDRS